jgi:hypothetical protein
MQLHFYETKLTNLKLKTRPKQLLGYHTLDIALPGSVTRLGENLTFGYFLFENFCTNEQFNIWFMVCILTFSPNCMEMYWIFFFLAKVLAAFPEIGRFSFQSSGHSAPRLCR